MTLIHSSLKELSNSLNKKTVSSNDNKVFLLFC